MLKKQVAEMDEVIAMQATKITSLEEESTRCNKIQALQDEKIAIQERELQINVIENDNEVKKLKEKLQQAYASNKVEQLCYKEALELFESRVKEVLEVFDEAMVTAKDKAGPFESM